MLRNIFRGTHSCHTDPPADLPPRDLLQIGIAEKVIVNFNKAVTELIMVCTFIDVDRMCASYFTLLH